MMHFVCSAVIRTGIKCLQVLLALLALAFPSVHAESFKLGGTGSGLAMMQILADAYSAQDKDFQLSIMPNLGSSGGIKALNAGAIDIAVTSRDLKPAESNFGMESVEYGRTPFVLATSSADPRGVTTSQAVDLISGRVTRWPDGKLVRLVMRPMSDGDSGLLSSFSNEMRSAVSTTMKRTDLVIAVTDQDSVNMLEKLPGSFGSSSLAVILAEKKRVYPISLDGVMPSAKTLAAHRYPFYKKMHLITKGSPVGQVKQFIDFVRSPAGRDLLTQNGHWVSNVSKQKGSLGQK